MPYSADLRSSYCHADINISWFYQAMSEFHMEIDFYPVYDSEDLGEKTEKERDDIKDHLTECAIQSFENHINDAFYSWTVYKVFGHKRRDEKFEVYETIWEYLFDVAEEYSRKHPEVEITHTSDDE